MEYASNAKGNAALTTGIIGTAGVGLNLLGNLLGANAANSNGSGCPCNGGCSENQWVNRYEATQQARIAELETEVKLRDANTYTLSQINGLRDYVERRFDRVEHEICDQKVYNAANTGAISCIQSQIAQLFSLTKLVIPNGSVCPGWGDVTVAPAAAPTTGA